MEDGNPAWDMAAYRYTLPDDHIAQRPLEHRDSSRLMVVDTGTSVVGHHHFSDLPDLIAQLPRTVHLVLNNTKVVAARLRLFKSTGGAVEVLLNEPRLPYTDPQLILSSSEPSVWGGLIGGRNVHVGMELHDSTHSLFVDVLERDRMDATVRLRWNSGEPLLDVLSRLGHMPLPPYIERADDEQDKERYQTVFAKNHGSAAAPTAGLHFTDTLLEKLSASGVNKSAVTLHVGMGTFKPVEAENVADHVMHSERVIIHLDELVAIANALRTQAIVLPVGTTSMRSIESAYWLGVQLLNGAELNIQDLHVPQFCAMDTSITHPTAIDSFQALTTWMQQAEVDHLDLSTQLMIAPGAHIGVTGGLITNFHQPGSTLLLLVAALIGDTWREVYQQAINSGYRFLSYGDAMLITRTHEG